MVYIICSHANNITLLLSYLPKVDILCCLQQKSPATDIIKSSGISGLVIGGFGGRWLTPSLDDGRCVVLEPVDRELATT